MPFLPPNQQRHSTEGIEALKQKLLKSIQVWVCYSDIANVFFWLRCTDVIHQNLKPVHFYQVGMHLHVLLCLYRAWCQRASALHRHRRPLVTTRSHSASRRRVEAFAAVIVTAIHSSHSVWHQVPVPALVAMHLLQQCQMLLKTLFSCLKLVQICQPLGQHQHLVSQCSRLCAFCWFAWRINIWASYMSHQLSKIWTLSRGEFGAVLGI